MEVPGSKWTTPSKVIENNCTKILMDLQIKIDKILVAIQQDIAVVDRQGKKTVIIDVVTPSDSNIRKKEHENLEKYKCLKEELERMWGVKASVVTGGPRAVTPKLTEWLQQIQEITSAISAQEK